MAILLFAVLMIALAVIVRRRGGTESPDVFEGAFLLAAPLPALVSLGIPALIGFAAGFGEANTRWMRGLSWTGVALSALMVPIGLALVVRAAREGRRWGWPLGGAALLAALPAAMIGLTYVLLGLAAILLRMNG